MKKSIYSAFLLACTVTHSVIAAETYNINPIESFVLFKVLRLGTAYVYGRFTGGLSGTVSFDSAAPDKSAVALEVKTDTLDTGFAKRDNDIKGPDFLNVKQFPAVTFKSKSVQKVTDQRGERRYPRRSAGRRHRRGAEARQVDRDHIALRGEAVEHGLPYLPAAAYPVDQDQGLTGSGAVVAQLHRPRKPISRLALRRNGV